MAAKAKYQGINLTESDDFPLELIATLRDYYIPQPGDHGDTANNFAHSILIEARWAMNELAYHQLNLDRKSIRAERDDLLRSVKETRQKLRTLSRDFDVLLGNDADPLGCADQLLHLESQIESRVTDERLAALPKKLLPNQVQSKVSTELAIRVLRVLERYGMSTAVTCDPSLGYTSDAVRILKKVGDTIRLIQEPATWRNIMSRAKQQGKD